MVEDKEKDEIEEIKEDEKETNNVEVKVEKKKIKKIKDDFVKKFKENKEISELKNKIKEKLTKESSEKESNDKSEIIDSKVIKKEVINRAIIIGTIAAVVVIIASIIAILVSQARNNKILEEYFSMMEDTPDEENKEKEKRIPIYSEDAKIRMQNIYEADTEEKIAYLTFDDGPSTNVTPQILQILEEENIKATFFVLGMRVEQNPGLVKQAYEAGHYIANHGYSHNYNLIYSSVNAILEEYNHTEECIRNAIGVPEYSSYLFRFPGGSSGGKNAKMKAEGMQLLDENNIAHINWNALSRDAEGKPTAESVVRDLKASVEGKNRVVILMHDTNAKQFTADTLKENIAYLREQGYSFKNFYDIMY